ncbi:hypothetical protein NVP1074O_40 [Vibrio phage 1.074.O._10N.222.49.B7]|nr:hypothetical protein NVP1074O_40 [Vibrio phage 1.074.O._10N.222.49.B7]
MNNSRLECIDKLNLTNRLREISRNEQSISSEMAARHEMLDNLLCTIHRDGGHYIEKHGYRKATNDAISKISKG